MESATGDIALADWSTETFCI